MKVYVALWCEIEGETLISIRLNKEQAIRDAEAYTYTSGDSEAMVYVHEFETDQPDSECFACEGERDKNGHYNRGKLPKIDACVYRKHSFEILGLFHRPTNYDYAKCDYCDERFSDYNEKREHKNNVHPFWKVIKKN